MLAVLSLSMQTHWVRREYTIRQETVVLPRCLVLAIQATIASSFESKSHSIPENCCIVCIQKTTVLAKNRQSPLIILTFIDLLATLYWTICCSHYRTKMFIINPNDKGEGSQKCWRWFSCGACQKTRRPEPTLWVERTAHTIPALLIFPNACFNLLSTNGWNTHASTAPSDYCTKKCGHMELFFESLFPIGLRLPTTMLHTVQILRSSWPFYNKFKLDNPVTLVLYGREAQCLQHIEFL